LFLIFQKAYFVHKNAILAGNAFVKMNRRATAMMFVCPSICLSVMGVHCDHTVHFNADLSL